MTADTSFIQALGMELVAGRNFNTADYKKHLSDTTVAFVLNESAVRKLSLNTATAVGTRGNMNGRRGEIVGVVKNFHFASLHLASRPLVFFNEEDQLQFIVVKLK